jgi:hypothetical protein
MLHLNRAHIASCVSSSLPQENNHLKRRLAGAGDAKMQAEVLQAQGSRRKDD